MDSPRPLEDMGAECEVLRDVGGGGWGLADTHTSWPPAGLQEQPVIILFPLSVSKSGHKSNFRFSDRADTSYKIPSGDFSVWSRRDTP